MLRTSGQPADVPANSWLTALTDGFLSFLPVKPVMALYDRVMPSLASDPLFSQLITELKSSLIVVGSTPEFAGKVIPEYVSQTLMGQLRLDELRHFAEALRQDLISAYADSRVPAEQRDAYKARALRRVLLNLGPHGLKYIQSLRPVNPNSWVGQVVETVRSDLPALQITDVQKLMIDDIKAHDPNSKYAKDFNKYFKIVKVLGAGTIGVVVEMLWRRETGEERVIVGKLNRENIADQFRRDGHCLQQAVARLLANNEVTAIEAESFLSFNDKLLEAELAETNAQVEKVNLAEALYEGPGVTTIRDIKELRGVGNSLIFMEKAEGIGFGKFMREKRKIISDPAASRAEKAVAFEELLGARKCFLTLYRLHLEKIISNKSVHRDLHPGNMFYKTDLITVFDRASDTISLEPAEHLRLRQFLFAIQLSTATADAHYLRFYYENQHRLPGHSSAPIAPQKIEKLLADVQAKLDAIKQASCASNVIKVDEASAEVSSVIVNAVLTVDRGLVPESLALLADSNKKLTDTFEEFSQIFAGTSFAKCIPVLERTEIMIALLISRQLNSAGLWTPVAWAHFKNTALRRVQGSRHLVFDDNGGDTQLQSRSERGEELLQFEKKFIYGIFGLSEEEARKMDILIPAAVIAAPVVLRLGLKTLGPTLTAVGAHLKDLPDMIRFTKWYHGLPGPRESIQTFASRLYAAGSSVAFLNRGASGALPLPPFLLQRSPTLLRHAPGVAMGAAMVLGYQTFAAYRADKKKQASASNKQTTVNSNSTGYEHVFSP